MLLFDNDDCDNGNKEKEGRKTAYVVAFIVNAELTAPTYIRYINLIIWLSVEMWFLIEQERKKGNHMVGILNICRKERWEDKKKIENFHGIFHWFTTIVGRFLGTCLRNA